uniref:AlNc14C145G7374 protein n=1 Tax=Albugo laibachii Nc14 TaxID=890382 RepID=F0WLI7_9STRA|nr:AlNc14C145G7374 [Albugo laibachii Nc14]|eukprot:CCA22150.1 AlNc14C145G7374 [Albugo laibachii Nc14]
MRTEHEHIAPSCATYCDIIVLDSSKKECQQLNLEKYRPTLPSKDQFLAQIPVKRRISHSGGAMSSGCIWVQHGFRSEECLECLRKIGSSTVLKLSDFTALAALHVSTTTRVVFLPNAMCLYELGIDIVAKAKVPFPIDSHLIRNDGHFPNPLTRSDSIHHVKDQTLRIFEYYQSVLAQFHTELLMDHRNPNAGKLLIDPTQLADLEIRLGPNPATPSNTRKLAPNKRSRNVNLVEKN